MHISKLGSGKRIAKVEDVVNVGSIGSGEADSPVSFTCKRSPDFLSVQLPTAVDLLRGRTQRGKIDLTEDPQSVVAKTLISLGLDGQLAPPPPLRRQSDGRSREWVQRYRIDAEQNGYPVT